MNWAATVWLIVLVFFIFAEASTVAVISLWFACGALAAMIASLFGAELWLQITLFVAVSGVLLCALRPLTKKFLKPRIVKTNLDTVIGSQGLVTQEIDNLRSCGQVKLGAMEWSARSTGGENLEVGTRIVVDRIEGVKVFVTPVNVPVTK